jgi:hypothetical protein
MPEIQLSKLIKLNQVEQEDVDKISPAERQQFFREYEEINALVVFGHDYQKDKYGNPIEQGIGSPKQQTAQHKAAIAREEERRRRMAAVDRIASA